MSAASALPLNIALANGAAASPVTVSLIKRRRFVSAVCLVMGDSFVCGAKWVALRDSVAEPVRYVLRVTFMAMSV